MTLTDWLTTEQVKDSLVGTAVTVGNLDKQSASSFGMLAAALTQHETPRAIESHRPVRVTP